MNEPFLLSLSLCRPPAEGMAQIKGVPQDMDQNCMLIWVKNMCHPTSRTGEKFVTSSLEAWVIGVPSIFGLHLIPDIVKYRHHTRFLCIAMSMQSLAM